EIHIVSNWGWVPGDGIGVFRDGQSNALKEDFFTARGNQKAARLRAKLAAHIGTSVSRFDKFARTLRFKVGFDCWEERCERAAERMEHRGLKSDKNALLVAVGIVRDWVKVGRQQITKAGLEATIAEHDLWLPPEVRPSVNVYLATIKEQQFDIEPDYRVD